MEKTFEAKQTRKVQMMLISTIISGSYFLLVVGQNLIIKWVIMNPCRSMMNLSTSPCK